MRAAATLAAVGFAVIGLCLLSSCYLTAQGARYLSIVATAKPAQKLLADPGTDADTRRLLETALAAREYAIGSIGLRETRNYRSLARVDSEHLVTVVQACAALSFERHLWSFPFIGRLPYKGFFDPAEAGREAERLKTLGYDVIARPSDAFSTLGFLADPLFTFMRDYDEFEIAELVIHEMTHATIFLRGSAAGNFNEELATFTGRQGALDFIESRHGKDSEIFRRAREGIGEARVFASFLRDTALRLEKIYASNSGDREKLEAKRAVIEARAAEYEKLGPTLFASGRLSRYAGYPMGRINNALLDLYRLYEGELEIYESYFTDRCGSDLATFIRTLRESGNPARELRAGS